MNMALALSGGTLTFWQILLAIVIMFIALFLSFWHFFSIGFWSKKWLLTILLAVFAIFPFDNLEVIRTFAGVLFFVLGVWATFSLSKKAGWVLVIMHILQYALVAWLAYSLLQGGIPQGYYNFL